MALDRLGRIEERRCRSCGQPIIATCDRTAQSYLTLFETGRAADPIAEHIMHPTAEKQNDLCHRCRWGNDPKVGRQNGLTIVPFDKIKGNKINAN
ncbi:hypothetical protein KAW48_03220 [candidate division WOR-3 bacterium]|nr:hypothetical protein [candidate division WOR-3 bacterium]